MLAISRFDCPSSGLTLRGLFSKTRPMLFVCFAVGLAIHVSLTRVGRFRAEVKAAKPLTTQFIKRAPRLTKPLELKKRPRLRRRQMQRQTISVKARARRNEASTQMAASRVVSSLARPVAALARSVSAAAAGVEPEVMAQSIQGAKEVENRVDLNLELIDVQALDTGRYHAMVVQDPSDRQNIRGFLHIALVTPVRSGYDLNILMRSMRRLANLGMNQFTQIRTDVWPALTFDSSDIFKVPWLHVTNYGEDLNLTESERSNLGAYLEKGGFLHADGQPPLVGGPYVPPIRLQKIITDALESRGLVRGKDWNFERLPNSHAIYHCFFDFDGPPPGAGAFKWQYPIIDFMEGVTVDGRLWAITSQMICTHMWGWWGAGITGTTGALADPTRAMQFGVNLIVFALTQEGSITHRLMESVQ